MLWFDAQVNEICVKFAFPEVDFELWPGKMSFLEF